MFVINDLHVCVINDLHASVINNFYDIFTPDRWSNDPPRKQVKFNPTVAATIQPQEIKVPKVK